MAHNLAHANGKASFAYYGESPWHRLGTKLDAPATACVDQIQLFRRGTLIATIIPR